MLIRYSYIIVLSYVFFTVMRKVRAVIGNTKVKHSGSRQGSRFDESKKKKSNSHTNRLSDCKSIGLPSSVTCCICWWNTFSARKRTSVRESAKSTQRTPRRSEWRARPTWRRVVRFRSFASRPNGKTCRLVCEIIYLENQWTVPDRLSTERDTNHRILQIWILCFRSFLVWTSSR